MGTFNPPADASFQLDIEGKTIALNFEKTGPTTARISWNIPVPAQGCDGKGRYCGYVVTIDSVPASLSTAPINGTVYTADPTGDRNLHAGDRIGTALVIGAFYEDTNTAFFDISGLTDNTAYYVAGYAVDCQHRYHTKGNHAYSLDYGNPDTPDTSGTQVFDLNSGNGVLGTDATGLVPGVGYSLEVMLDGSVIELAVLQESGFANPDFPPTIPAVSNVSFYGAQTLNDTIRCANCDKDIFLHRIFIDGIDAQTYDDLVEAINNQFALMTNPITSPVPPNTGILYWDAINEKLFQWDGAEHVELSVLVEPTDPSVVVDGTYWFDTVNDILYLRVLGAWVAQTIVSYHKDPTVLDCSDYWFNGTNSYNWNGTTWCELITHNQIKDPSCAPELPCGSYWYDVANGILNEWSVENQKWNETFAIVWDTAPNTLAVGTHWLDDTTSTLSTWDGAAWTIVASPTTAPPLFEQEIEPTTPANDAYWFVPSTEELFQYDLGTTTWNAVSVLVWPDDPTNTQTCDLWWNSTTDVLSAWDVTTNTWVAVAAFTQSTIDPALPPVLNEEDVWYNPTDNTLSRWLGNSWQQVTFINFATDPTTPVVDQVWFNTTTLTWQKWTGVAWSSFNPVDSATDPTVLPSGTYWFDTTSNGLFTWNGVTWISTSFTTMPLTPAIGSVYFNTSDNILYKWDGTAYIATQADAVVYLSPRGNLLFMSSSSGTSSKIRVNDGVEPGLLAAIGTSTQQASTSDGTDGVSGQPSYGEIGVGDDGTSDERRELAYSMRAQLGWPVVEVELTDYQMDTAIEAALEAYRKRAGTAYERCFFFLDVQPGVSNYFLTDKTVGFNKVVNVLGLYRFNSAFLSTATGAGVYAQVVLQELYNAGSFDLASYHLIADYIEQLEQLFATRLTYYWNEPTRRLDIYKSFYIHERVLVEASLERTEQQLMTHRFSKAWIEKWALSEARLMLAEIRGKYASLPGAGGGVALNASELINRADMDRAELIQQLEDYIAEKPEDYGQLTQFVIG